MFWNNKKLCEFLAGKCYNGCLYYYDEYRVKAYGTLTKPWFYECVILSAAKNLSLCGSIEALRFAQGDMTEH